MTAGQDCCLEHFSVGWCAPHVIVVGVVQGCAPAAQHLRAGGVTLMFVAMHAGLDSATTFTVTKWLRVVTHAMRLTTVVSLLQPAPEVFALFDDVLLLTDGCVSPS